MGKYSFFLQTSLKLLNNMGNPRKTQYYSFPGDYSMFAILHSKYRYVRDFRSRGQEKIRIRNWELSTTAIRAIG